MQRPEDDTRYISSLVSLLFSWGTVFPEPEALHFTSLVCERALRMLLSLFLTAGVLGTGWHS